MSHNINMHGLNKDSNYGQKRRQSKDFNEIWNIQTDMKVSRSKYDKIFHNWHDPDNCKVPRCWVCDVLNSGLPVEHEIDGIITIFFKGNEPWPKE